MEEILLNMLKSLDKAQLELIITEVRKIIELKEEAQERSVKPFHEDIF